MTGVNYSSLFSNEPMWTHCECCKPRTTAMTLTAIGHKWTKKEIEEEIIYLAKEMATARWIDRGDLRRQLKHWTEKLAKYEEFKSEFK